MERGELRLQLTKVRCLLVERVLRRHRRFLRLDHRALGKPLEAIALVACNDRLVAERLRIVASGDRR